MTPHVDPALLEMFAAEVETHMAALNDGLLALEQNPDETGRSEALMRAAHSIKGAAKLVGLQAAVDVAHVIEDCFVAAREGRLAMTSSLVDVLLEGVDLLGRAAQFDAAPEHRASQAQIASTVQRILQASTAKSPVTQTAAKQPTLPAKSPQTASVRIPLFRLPENLDESWVHDTHREIAAVLQQGAAGVDFDFAGVTEIDPLGLALLTLVARRAESTSCEIRLQQVPQRFGQLLRAVGLDQFCRISAMGD